jgi:hypothetical protein
MGTKFLWSTAGLFALVMVGNHFFTPAVIQSPADFNKLNTAPSHMQSTHESALINTGLKTSHEFPEPLATEQKLAPPLNLEKINSLKHARLNGDTRSPTLAPHELTHRSSEYQKQDPDQYNQYQANKKRQLILNYIEAAQPKINRLKEQVEIAKAKGLPKDELAEGEEKIVRLQEMVEQLKNQYPDISTPQV